MLLRVISNVNTPIKILGGYFNANILAQLKWLEYFAWWLSKPQFDPEV